MALGTWHLHGAKHSRSFPILGLTWHCNALHPRASNPSTAGRRAESRTLKTFLRSKAALASRSLLEYARGALWLVFLDWLLQPTVYKMAVKTLEGLATGRMLRLTNDVCSIATLLQVQWRHFCDKSFRMQSWPIPYKNWPCCTCQKGSYGPMILSSLTHTAKAWSISTRPTLERWKENCDRGSQEWAVVEFFLPERYEAQKRVHISPDFTDFSQGLTGSWTGCSKQLVRQQSVGRYAVKN